MKDNCPDHKSNRELSDEQLVARADSTAHREHDEGIHLLDILVELDRRSLCLGLGYSSLFDFCVRRWLFSRAKAGRYIAVARATRRFSELRELLETRKLTIGNAALLVGVLTPANSEEMLRRAAGRTYKEIEEIAMEHRTARSVRETVRPIGMSKNRGAAGDGAKRGGAFRDGGGSIGATVGDTTTDGAAVGRGQSGSAADPEIHREPNAGIGAESITQLRVASRSESRDSPMDETHGEANTGSRAETQSGAQAQAEAQADAEARAETRAEARYEVRISVSGTFVDKLDRVRAIRSGSAKIEDLFEVLLDDFLRRNDPKQRAARRADRSGAASSAEVGSAPAGPSQNYRGASGDTPDAIAPPRTLPAEKTHRAQQTRQTQEASTTPRPPRQAQQTRQTQDAPTTPRPPGHGHPSGRSRHVPIATRDAVFERDEGRCTYMGPDGVRCSSTQHLQVDHVLPFSLGGDHEVGNLRLLCGRHNRHEARRVLTCWHNDDPSPSPDELDTERGEGRQASDAGRPDSDRGRQTSDRGRRADTGGPCLGDGSLSTETPRSGELAWQT